MSRLLDGRVVRVGAMAAAGIVVAAGALAVAALVSGELPGDSWSLAPVVAAAAVGAAAWRPARRVARRVAPGGTRAVERVLQVVSAAQDRALEDDELMVEVAAAIRSAFGARRVSVWSVDVVGRLVESARVPSAPREPAAPVPLDAAALRALGGSAVVGRDWLGLWLPDLIPAGEDVRAVPIAHSDAALAVVVLARSGSARFRSEDDVALAELGRRLGILLHNRALDAALQATLADLRRTNDELRASRVRLVAAADAERRRIERDLHDGAQQRLVALAVHLRLAEQTIADDPATAPELLGEMGTDLREAIAELRTLAHGIYPPLLMDAGLAEALRVAAGRSPSLVTVRTSEAVGRYAPEVEAAAYFCCVEALQNAAKHAEGSAVRVEVDDDGERLSVLVEDEGPGFDPATAARGHGLVNMADRAGAVGGRVTIDSEPGRGTRLRLDFEGARGT